MSQNIVKTEYQSSLTIRGTCHQDFQNVAETFAINFDKYNDCLLYTSPSPRDRTRSRMPSSA